MDRVNIKYAPALNDLTVDDCFSDEGMEAVLCEEEQARLSRNKKAAVGNSGSSDEQSLIFEKPEDAQLLSIIQQRHWAELLHRVKTQPHITYVKFSGRSSSAGNLLLHEAYRHRAPIGTIEDLIDANEKAVSTRGHSGYLALHYACSSGASEHVIELLVSMHPDAVKVADDHSRTLPLHLASKMGASEEALMTLLTAYPEAATIRDDFGRLPMDYAKNILNDKAREIAVGCLRRARWLQSAAKNARETTGNEYQQRISGYEESQAAHLKMIKEIHDEEILDMEKKVEEQEGYLSSQRERIENLEKRIKDDAEEYKQRIDNLEKMLKAKHEELSTKVDHEQKQVDQIQAVLHLKTEKLEEVSTKLEQVHHENTSLAQQVDARTRDFQVALEDIETLNKHAEWLESILGSIRIIANSEAPIVSSIQRREHSIHTGGSTLSDSSRRHPRKSPSITTSRSKSKFETNIPIYGRKMSSMDSEVLSARPGSKRSTIHAAESRSQEAWDCDPSQVVQRRDGNDE